jgi:signal transduction histidine kinase
VNPPSALLPALLDDFPGLVLELDPAGHLLAANRGARELTAIAPDATFVDLLDTRSREKFLSVTRDQTHGVCTELFLATATPLLPRTFYVSALHDERRIVIEITRDDAARQLHDSLTALNSELVTAQRESSKRKAQLERTLAQLNTTVEEKTHLATVLREHGRQLELQNEELLTMTEELRRQRVEADELNTRLGEQSAELERVMLSRERFFSAMSHELRTPLTAILGYDHLLLDGIAGELTARQREFIERTRSAAQHLNELLDDLLDLAKLESGTLDLNLEQTSIGHLIRDVAATVSPSAQSAGSELRLDLAGAPPDITTDARALRQILLNLLSNAIKFGGSGPVDVRCTRELDQVRIDVTDRGAGVEPGDAERIFEEFGQGAEGRKQKGTGLGLAISRQLAERLGGRLWLVPDSGAGATFRLELPVAGPPAE